MTPYILLVRKKLPPESAPSPEQVYDKDRQLWINKNSGAPLVSSMRSQASQFGETTMTETREGADRTEGGVHAVDFGETLQTQTHDSMDQADVLEASQLGETTMTRSHEGADQPETASLQEFHAAYSHF